MVLKASPYGGVIVALVTPFHDDLSVNYELACELASSLVDDGVEGIVVSGTTGEAPTLSASEKVTLVARMKERLGDRALVWAGASGYDTRASVELARGCEGAGADGILAVTPYYNRPSQEGLSRHFRAMAGAVSLPTMLYNVPGRTGVNLAPKTVLELSSVPNIVAVKEASGNLDQASEILAGCPSDFYVYSGDDSLTLPILSVGGSGVVSVAAHLVGKDLRRMVDLYQQGDLAGASSIHLGLFRLFRVLFIASNPVPVKTALRILRWDVGGFRLPLCQATDGEENTIKRVLVDLELVS